jgi:hypothetical protein
MTKSQCDLRFPDDESVAADVLLLRRIPPRHFFLDENLGRIRASSAAFEDDGPEDPMSVYLASIIEREGRAFQSVMQGHSEYGLVGLTAGFLRSHDQTIHPDGEDDSSHAVACGPKTGSRRRSFAREALWVIPPPTRF